MRQVVAYKGLKEWKISNRQAQKVVVVAYRVVDYSRFQLWGFEKESFGVLDWRSLMGCGRLRDLVAHGGLSVAHFKNKLN